MEYLDHYALRSHRKRSGLTQEDVAVLIGARSPSQVSRQESGEREPDLHAALAYHIIYDAPMRHLLPKPYRDIAQQVHTRAEALAARLKEQPDGLHLGHRIEHLRQMAGRISLFDLEV
jgi:transcriptional regulator with XRE-family HTH domain